MKRSSTLKFFDTLKIGSKLGLGFGVLIFLSIISGLFQFTMGRSVASMFEGVRSADKMASLGAQVKMELLEMRQYEKNFLLRYTGQSFQGAYGNYVLPNQQHSQRLLELIEDMSRMSPRERADEQQYAAFLERLKMAVQSYQDTFLALVENIRVRGDRDHGLLNELNDSLDILDFRLALTYELEARIVSSRLQKNFLAYLRFGLKSTGYNYQGLPGQEHMEDFQHDGQRLRVLLNNAENLSSSEQESLQRLAEESRGLFNELVVLDKEILHQEIRLSANARSVSTLAARIVSKEDDFQQETFHNFLRTQQRTHLIVICFFLLNTVVSIALALLFTRSIAGPITSLTDTAGHIAGASTLQEWTEHIALERQDEIGILAQAFNRMTERLRSLISDLQEREERYRRIFEDTKDLIFISTPDGRIVDVNPACAELSGYTRDEICRMNSLDFYQNPKDRQTFRKALERDGMLKNFEVPLCRKDGRIVECIVTANLQHNAAGQLLGYQGIIHDMTATKQAERERLRAVELLKAKESAEAANRAKSAFLANMSHELRTPLNAIIGFSQVMARNRNLAPEQKEHIRIINRSGEHLLMLVNQVLALSKIEAGRMTLNENDVDLFRLLHDLEDMFRLKAMKNGLLLTFVIGEGVPQYIRSDEVKLRQVLINLLNNAIAFTEKGEVQLSVSSKQFSVNNEFSSGDHEQSAEGYKLPTKRDASLNIGHWNTEYCLLFTVKDSGVGIAPEELPTIFDAFSQVGSDKQRQEGTGLGLPISRKFVNLMGGDLRVVSESARGSTFSFEIQVAGSAQTTRNNHQSTQSKPILALEPGQPRYRLLIVDDEPNSRKLLVTLLSNFDFDLREASNGLEALNIWKTWQPHAIWMDMQMPVLDGYEATKKIRELGAGKSTLQNPIPVIVALTASGFEEDRRAVLAAGCDDYVRKPFSSVEIFEMLQKHLELRYVYAQGSEMQDEEASAEVKTAWNAQALSAMPDEWLLQLKQSAEEANIKELLSLAEKIREQNSSVADALVCLINDFEYGEILTQVGDAAHLRT